jgi:hypothetical protein
MKYVYLKDRGDRLGSHITWYISSIIYAVINNYHIVYVKERHNYGCYGSIFITYLFEYIDAYNLSKGERPKENKLYENEINRLEDYISNIYETLICMKCDYMTYFKEHIFKNDSEKLNKLAFEKNFIIPFNSDKTILIHLRLDDVKDFEIYDSTNISEKFKLMIDNDCEFNKLPHTIGQSPLNEDKIKGIVENILTEHNDYEVLVVTSPNSTHSLPYKTICNSDPDYDLYLLSRCKILIGSRSTFSFAALLFGEHDKIYYPLWDHAVTYGLTTKYDNTKNVVIF